MIVCGIDPGLRGGVAFLDEHTPLMTAKLPKLAKAVDVVELAQILNLMAPTVVIIERQSIRNGQGGAMTIGANYGRLLATVELLGLRYKIVQPATWKRKAMIKPGVTGKEKQQASFEAARREFGGEALTRMKLKYTMDGPVEAMLIALFGA